jgi:hypothetical protein
VAIGYATIRILRKAPVSHHVVDMSKVFMAEEIMSGTYLSGLQSSMDRYSHGWSGMEKVQSRAIDYAVS